MNLDDDCVDPSTICKEYNSKLTLREQLKLVSIIANLFWKHHVCTSGNEANDLATTLFMTLLDIGLAEEAYRIAFEFELTEIWLKSQSSFEPSLTDTRIW